MSPDSADGEREVVALPTKNEEHARRVMAEAQRLANLAPGEWPLWIESSAEQLGVTRVELEKLVRDTLKRKDKEARERKAEERQQEERAERQRVAAQRQRERDQARIDREAERKAKDKRKAFATLLKLPRDQQEARLAELAKRLGDDIAVLRSELDELVEAARAATPTPTETWNADPWPEPVALAQLLSELIAKLNKHIVAKPHEILVIALWIAMAWVHEVAATHSAYLAATSAEPFSGKTTLLGVLEQLVPKPFTAVEPTGASIYRFVDREKPTLLLDEADDLFVRKTDIKHIFNAAWTRGTKIPRQVNVQGVSTTVWFDPFCPKAVSLWKAKLPAPLRSRSIILKLWPKTDDEKVETFKYRDDDEFAQLRRKLARWATDNGEALKDATPLLPAGFANRLAANYRLILAVAEAAGGTWAKQARDAAERLSRTRNKPSLGLQLLQALCVIFASGVKEITSEAVVTALTHDPTAVWCEYNRGGPITQRQVADLLDQYDIDPIVVHPARDQSRHGYKAEQFTEVFARFRIGDANIQTRKSKA